MEISQNANVFIQESLVIWLQSCEFGEEPINK